MNVSISESILLIHKNAVEYARGYPGFLIQIPHYYAQLNTDVLSWIYQTSL